MTLEKQGNVAASAKKRLQYVNILSGAMACLMPVGVSQVAMAQESAGEPADTVVVTGTRVQRDGFEAPTPTVVLDAAEISRDAPQNLGDFIQKLPSFANSPTTDTTVTGNSTAGSGVNSLNLRSIGANRTLVLIDGRRMAPGMLTNFYNNTGAADINPVPDALIERVDVVTGGASAPYGSDAIAGIVNFVLDRDFTGLKGSLQGGVTTYGDNKQYSLSLAGGTGFANDRGHILFSIEHDFNEGILRAQGARDWVDEGWERVVNPNYTSSNGEPYYLFKNMIGSSRFVDGGLVYTGPLSGIAFGEGGAPRQFNYGTPFGTAMQGGEWQNSIGVNAGVITPKTSLVSELGRISTYTRASFELTDNIEIYGQYIHSRSDTKGYGGRVTDQTMITDDNPFIPDAVLAAMSANSLTSIPVSYLGRSVLGIHDRRFNHIVVGLEGEQNLFGTDWAWDFAYTRSNSRTLSNLEDNMIRPRFDLATDVVTNPSTGLPICRSTLTDPTNGCVPYNIMGLNVNDPAAEGYLYEPLSWQDRNIKQSSFAFAVSGEPFSIWAGPVSVAAGYEHRNESVTGTSSDLDKVGGFFYVGNYVPTVGEYNIDEGFVETVIPIMEDVIDLNGAVRVTNYSTSGTVVTWKAGVTFRPVEDVLFRATRSRDIRSPSLADYFNPGSGATVSIADPFNGGSTFQYNAITQGNTELAPEVAQTIGVGVVLQPRFLPGFQASVDYYNIDIGDAIVQANSEQTLQECFDGNLVFCANIVRDANGFLDRIYTRPVNADALKTEGLEIAAAYSRPASDFIGGLGGTLSVQAYATHVMNLTTINYNGTVREGAGAHDGSMYPINIAPKWRYMATIAYDSDAVSTSVTGRGFGSGVHSNDWVECTSGCPANSGFVSSTDNNYMPGEFYMDTNITFHLGKGKGLNPDLFFTVDNVFNKSLEGFTFHGYAPGFYDRIGRRFRAGIRFQM